MVRRKNKVKIQPVGESTLVEEPVMEPVITAPPIVAPKPTWQQLVQQLPEANSVPTQRWYGETFYPTYSTLREQLRALANEST